MAAAAAAASAAVRLLVFGVWRLVFGVGVLV
jgi:hypothetical protein